ncbi:MAG: endonuclease/exonuclease/phosphatase family protein [Planctomycetota bacterium]|jgi:hypothetical protein
MTGRPRRLRRLLRPARLLPLVAAAATVAGWLAGRGLSDRWGWSQWLLWIPTPIATLAALAGLAWAVARRRGRAWTTAWGVCLAVTLAHLALVEHRLHRRPPDAPPGLTVVHWTMSHDKTGPPIRHTQPLVDLDGDVTVLVDAWITLRSQAVRDWLGPEARVTRVGRFFLLTRLPVLELRPLVAAEGITVTLAVVDATASLGRPLVLYLVDLPSRPWRGRMRVARRARRWLDEVSAPAPDLVVGDFNMTRGGAALRTLFPDLAHAYDEGGGGYGATFHRRFPLYHIDHVLTGPRVRAASYRIVDPGVGRHRIQVTTVVPRPTSTSR